MSQNPKSVHVVRNGALLAGTNSYGRHVIVS